MLLQKNGVRGVWRSFVSILNINIDIIIESVFEGLDNE